MSLNSGKITAPISIDDIKNALGEASNDLGTLCKSVKVNMWSLHKPVVYPAPFENSGGEGSDGNCGLQPFTFTNLLDIVNYYTTDKRNGWSYNKPTGGAASPYRIGDFVGYYNAATSPFGDLVVVGGNRDFSDTITATCSVRSELSDYEMGLSQIALFNDLYFGIVLLSGGGTITTANFVALSGVNLELNIANLSEGNYTLYPFLSTTKINPQSIGTNFTGTFYTVPGLAPINVTIGTSYRTANFRADYITELLPPSVALYIDITNKTNSDISFSWTAKYRYDYKAYNEAMESGEQTINSAVDYVVPANSTRTLNGIHGIIFENVDENVFIQGNKIWLNLRLTGSGKQNLYNTVASPPIIE